MDSPNRERYYRCYFIRNDRIARHEDVYCYEDEGAIEKVREILAASEYLSVELWRGKDCIARLDKPHPAAADTN
jgi:hypothetical protein